MSRSCIIYSLYPKKVWNKNSIHLLTFNKNAGVWISKVRLLVSFKWQQLYLNALIHFSSVLFMHHSLCTTSGYLLFQNCTSKLEHIWLFREKGELLNEHCPLLKWINSLYNFNCICQIQFTFCEHNGPCNMGKCQSNC